MTFRRAELYIIAFQLLTVSLIFGVAFKTGAIVESVAAFGAWLSGGGAATAIAFAVLDMMGDSTGQEVNA